MFDAPFQDEVAFSQPRRLVLSDNARAAAADLAAALGAEAALVASEAELAADWPQYVVARARTGGAFIVERAAMAEPAGALRLARGRLFGRAAAALVVAGQLVFALESESALAAAQAA
ncbi:MAG: hypothetical protein AAGM38_11780 [Pseudomonadota bacterium]